MIIPFNDPRAFVVLSTWVGISVVGILLMLIFRKRRHAVAQLAKQTTKTSLTGTEPSTEDTEASPTGTETATKEPDKPKKGGFFQKLGSYLLINLLFFILAWAPYKIYALSVVMLGFCCMYEVAAASFYCRNSKGVFASPAWYAVSCAVVIGAFAINKPQLTFKVIVLVGIIHTIIASFVGDIKFLLNRGALAGIAVLYFPACLGCHLYLKWVDPSGFLVIFYYVVVCATDSFGQITGTIIGGPKLVPFISPGKTISGAIGGTISAIAVAIIIRSCLPNTPLLWVGLAGLVISIAAQLGDLVISTWKRFMNIKDFSDNLGAHGGVIDRFDSMLLAASVFFLFTSIMPH
jgi:phosphatidate cytidylyltransferase